MNSPQPAKKLALSPYHAAYYDTLVAALTWQTETLFDYLARYAELNPPKDRVLHEKARGMVAAMSDVLIARGVRVTVHRPAEMVQ